MARRKRKTNSLTGLIKDAREFYNKHTLISGILLLVVLVGIFFIVPLPEGGLSETSSKDRFCKSHLRVQIRTGDWEREFINGGLGIIDAIEGYYTYYKRGEFYCQVPVEVDLDARMEAICHEALDRDEPYTKYDITCTENFVPEYDEFECICYW